MPALPGSPEPVSDISQQEFDFAPVPRAETKWPYRRTFAAIAGLGGIGWGAIIIACARLFHWHLM